MYQTNPLVAYGDFLDTCTAGELHQQLAMVNSAAESLTPDSRTGARECAIQVGEEIHRRLSALAELENAEPSLMPLDTYSVDEHLQRFPQH